MLKRVLSISAYSIRQRILEPRIICLFILLIAFIWNDITPIVTLVKMTGMRTNPLLFPFFAGDPVKQLILLAGIIFLFSDAPFINKSQPYIIVRSKRYSWMLGQILYIIIASAIYFLILMLISVIILLPNATFATNGWGKIVNTLAQTNAGEQINLQFGVLEKIIANYSPYKAFLLCFLLESAVASFLGLLIFVINLNFNRTLGLIAGGVVLVLDFTVTNALPTTFYSISPASLSRLDVIDPSGFSRYPTLAYSFIFFGIGIIILSIALVVTVRNKNIEITSEI